MQDERNSDPIPADPAFPAWARVAGYVSAVAFLVGRYALDLANRDSLLLASPAVALFAVGALQHYMAERRHELALMEWQIRSARQSIAIHEAELAEGQPDYDDDDPAEWEFNRKHWIANARDRIEAIEIRLNRR